MYKLEFTLKQHTPIIHFQTNSQFATIRPTEFKTKLDKFLIGQWTGCYGLKETRLKELFEKPKYHQYVKQGYDFKIDNNGNVTAPTAPTLDYQIKITVLSTDNDGINGKILQKDKIEKDFKLFFGNLGDGNPDKKILNFHSDIQILIKSVNVKLIDEIKNVMCDFLFHTNFGTRQNKGFGSFYLHYSIHETLINKDWINRYPAYKFSVDVSGRSELEAQKTVFSHIDFLYRTMRSGINRKTTNRSGPSLYYIKPTIWHYLKGKYFQWDKKTIKNQFYMVQTDNQITRYIANNGSPVGYLQTIIKKYLWRDLLGFSSTQNWKYYPNDRGEDIHSRKISPDRLKRYTSPITFKPLRKDKDTFIVFILLDQQIAKDAKNDNHNTANFPSSEIFNKNVQLMINGDGTSIFNIPFPSSFDYFEFLRESFRLTYAQLKIKGKNENDDLKIIKHIFDQLNYQNPYSMP